jgi:tetratricopeptide (TPR) repeat protein
LAAAWQVLREKYPGEFTPDKERARAWERRAAEECEARGLWHGAAAHLDRLIEDGPPAGGLYARRARAHAELRQWEQARADYAWALEGDPARWDLWAGRAAAAAGLGRWDEAAADYTRAIERKGDDPDLWLRRGQAEAERGKWDRAAADLGKAIGLGRNEADVAHQHAVALLGAGDREGYRHACARLARRLGGSDDEAALSLVARSCTLAADAVPDLQPQVRRAEQTVGANPRSAPELVRLGALLYRAGQFEPAVRRLEEAARLGGEGPAPRGWLFLAMANQRLGRGTEARKWLDRAAAGAGSPSVPWQERLEYQLLRREAEALVGGPRP